MTARAMPDDVGPLSWLAEVTAVSISTIYRQAALGELSRFGVFKVGSQYRVSKPRALRAIHGADVIEVR
jgi:hypothetical protein